MELQEVKTFTTHLEIYLNIVSKKQNNEKIHAAIIGTGNYARALASQFHQAELTILIGSRNPNQLKFEGVELVTYEEAVRRCDIVFFCVPAHAFNNVATALKSLLVGKVVVDVSNLENQDDASNAMHLQSLLSSSVVVKALNTVSAYTLENGAYGASRDTYVCGDDEERKRQVMQLLREIGLNPIDRGGIRSAVIIEKLPFRFFNGWGVAVTITFLTLVPILLYTYLRYFWYEDQSKRTDEDLALYIANRTIGWLMFWLLGLTYLPGIFAGFIQLAERTKYTRFPRWLDRWLKCRKQLGLICLLLASIHACMSCLVLGAGEAKHMSTITVINKNVILYQLLDTKAQVSLLFAVLALALMGILGVTSLPSVNARMSWREWGFVQRGLGFTSLVFGFLHVIIYVHQLWDPNYKFGLESWKREKGIFPPGAFVMPMFPLLVIILKFILMLPVCLAT